MKSVEHICSELRDRIAGIKVIDAHEHLVPESYHLECNFNFFNLFIPYVQYDLYSAGMPKEWLWKLPCDDDIDTYWKVISPLWNYVKHGSYARTLRLALKEFWGIEDINDSNYRDIGTILNQGNKKGLYKEILVDKCNIEYVLNQQGVYKYEQDFIKGHFQISGVYSTHGKIREFIKSYGNDVNLNEYCDYIKKELIKAKSEGIVLVKFDASGFLEKPDFQKAYEEFEKYKKDDNYTLSDDIHFYLCDTVLSYLKELQLVAAVHTGVWEDIRRKSPEHMFSVVDKYPEITFDIYHMGMPYVRECGFLGKNYQNAYLNLCWSHIVSPEMAINGLEEWMDYIPNNKIIGFGGDYVFNPQNVWAHLEVAKDNLAEVFARKVYKGILDMESAESIIKMWMYDNPKSIYKL